jgi:uncharacterized protein YodC (DUF2158 family)
MLSADPALISQCTCLLVGSLGGHMKRKLGVVAAAVLLGGFVSTNAFAGGASGNAGSHAGVIAGGGGRIGALAIVRGLGGVGPGAGSPRPFLTLTPPDARIGALAIGVGLGGVIGAGSSGTFTPRGGRSYSVPLFAGARFSPSKPYSTPLNSGQPVAPQGTGYYFGSYAAPSQSDQGGTTYAGTFATVAGPLEKLYPLRRDDRKLSLNDAASQPQNVSLPDAQDQSNENRNNLKVGARVKLRSGSPLMAVLSVSGTDVTCVWFDAVGQAETGTFPAASLASLGDDQKRPLNNAAPQPQNVSLPHAQDQSDENQTNLKVGARVRLRSGGPLMAVLSVSGTDVTCVWFDAAGHAATGTFPASGHTCGSSRGV